MYIERNGHPIHYLNMSAFSNSSIIYWPCQLLGLVHVIALLIFALDMGLVFLSLYLSKEKQGCSIVVRMLASHQCGSPVWFQSGAYCGSSLLFVLALLQEFFSRFSGFPPSKPKPPNSNLSMMRTCMENRLRLVWLPVSECCNFSICSFYTDSIYGC